MRGGEALIVEAEPVDEGGVLGEPKHSRLFVAGLRARRDRTDLDEAEAEPEEAIDHLGILVESAGKSDWIWKIESQQLAGEAWIRGRHFRHRHPHAEGANREAMRDFSVEAGSRATTLGATLHDVFNADAGAYVPGCHSNILLIGFAGAVGSFTQRFQVVHLFGRRRRGLRGRGVSHDVG